MAHYLAPPGPQPGYDVDNRLAPGSIWRIQIPVGQRREVVLWGGVGLAVSSNNPAVVPNDGFREIMSRGDGLRTLSLLGHTTGTSILEAKMGSATWCALQVQVGTATLADTDGSSGDLQIALSPVQLAAVLEGESIQPGETSNNRLWGGLQIVGGALELVG